MAKLARSLRVLRDDNLNIRWPQRPRRLDGWIGDEWHEQRKSDHNPNGRDTVDATDTDSAQTGNTPIHVPTVIAAMLTHPSTHYVIHRGRIMDADDQFQPRRYTGKNPHDKHIHDSIRQTAKAENSTVAYRFILKPMSWGTLKRGSKGRQVKELQAYLIGYGYTLRMDEDYGPATEKAVRSFQAKQGIEIDGIVGPETRGKLRPSS